MMMIKITHKFTGIEILFPGELEVLLLFGYVEANRVLDNCH